MTADELEAAARAVLDPATYDFFAGGAAEERTLAGNLSSWDELWLRPRVLRDVSSVDTSTTALGSNIASPIGVAPTAFHRLAHPDAEPATASGSAAAGALFVLSTRSSTPIEDVASASGGAPWWYQVYVLRDRGLTESLVQRAAACGARALVLTGDTPRLGVRNRDVRNAFATRSDAGGVESLDRPGDGGEQSPAATVADIAWLREVSGGLPVLVKGILRGDEASRCLEAGAAGVLVSNHGGRQLDGAVPTAWALPEVVEAVGDRGEVHVDGGVRRGTDVVKALALGARSVFVGRPVLWGLATGGADGVAAVLDALRDELVLAMALCGCSSVADLTPDLVTRRRA